MAKPLDPGTRAVIIAKQLKENQMRDKLIETNGVKRLPQVKDGVKIGRVIRRHEN